MATDALTLRRAVPADAARLALLGSATFLTAFASDHPGDALVAHCAEHHSAVRYAGWAADPEVALWILETALGAPIGYALLARPELAMPVEPGDIELKRIYVLNGWQGGGWGRKLLETVIDEAARRGASRLLLCVYKANHGAQAFYARHGFERIGTQTFMVGDVPFEDWVLARRLD